MVFPPSGIIPKSAFDTLESLLKDEETAEGIKKMFLQLDATDGTGHPSAEDADTLIESIKTAADTSNGGTLTTNILRSKVRLDSPADPSGAEEKEMWKFLTCTDLVPAKVEVEHSEEVDNAVEISLSWEEDVHTCHSSRAARCAVPCPTMTRHLTEGTLFLTVHLLAESLSGARTGTMAWNVKSIGQPCVLLEEPLEMV